MSRIIRIWELLIRPTAWLISGDARQIVDHISIGNMSQPAIFFSFESFRKTVSWLRFSFFSVEKLIKLASILIFVQGLNILFDQFIRILIPKVWLNLSHLSNIEDNFSSEVQAWSLVIKGLYGSPKIKVGNIVHLSTSALFPKTFGSKKKSKTLMGPVNSVRIEEYTVNL